MHVNEKFQKAITAPSPRVAFRLTFPDKEVIDSYNWLTEAELIFNSPTFVGMLASWQLTAKFVFQDKPKDYRDSEVFVEIGAYEVGKETVHWIPMGYYTIRDDGQQNDEIMMLTTIKAFDDMEKLDNRFTPLSKEEMTGLEITEELLKRNGLTFERPTTNLMPRDDFGFFSRYLGATVTVNKTFPIDTFKGGKNLIKDSGRRLYTTDYLMHSYQLTGTFVDGEEMTVSIKGQLGADRKRFAIYNSGGSISLASLYAGNQGSDGVYRISFKWQSGLNTNINLYHMNSGDKDPSTVEWIKLERGNVATEYSPAPEDGYGYSGDDGAYHIQGKGGTHSIKFYGSIKTSEMDVQYTSTINVKAFTKLLITYNGAGGGTRRYEPNDHFIYTYSYIGNGRSALQTQFRTENVDDEFDCIAVDARIWIGNGDFIKGLHFDDQKFKRLNIGTNQAISDREVLKQYLQLNMAVGYVDRNRKFRIKTIFENRQIEDTVTNDDYDSFEQDGLCGPINSVIYANSAKGSEDGYQFIESLDQASVEKNGKSSIAFGNNLFLELLTLQEQQLAVDRTLTIVNGYQYMPLEIKLFARPYYDPYDTYYMTNMKGVKSVLPITNMTFTYNGGLIGTLKTSRLPESLPEAHIPNIFERVTNAEIVVNRVEKEIYAVVSDVKTMGQTIEEQGGRLSLTDTALQAEIYDRVKQGEDIISQTGTLINQTINSVRIEINELKTIVNDGNSTIEDIRMYFDFRMDGMTIGKTNSIYKTVIDNESVRFMENGTVNTEIGQQRMMTNKAEIKESLVIGKTKIIVSPFNNSRILWRKI